MTLSNQCLYEKAKLVRPDGSKTMLRTWYSQGFRAVKLKLGETSCRVCRSLRNTEFYIWNLFRKDHPLFRMTHPNCLCGFVRVEESNIKHNKFDSKIGYKIRAKKIVQPNKPIVPPKKETKQPEEPKIDLNLKKKIDQLQKEVKKTNEELNKLDKQKPTEESENKSDDKRKTLTRFREELTKKLDKLTSTQKALDLRLHLNRYGAEIRRVLNALKNIDTPL